MSQRGDDTTPLPGLVDSVRRLLATLVALLQLRADLLVTELEEQLHRLAGLLLWGAIALFCGTLTVLMLAFTLMVVFWDQHRVLTASLLTGGFAVVFLLSLWAVRRRLAARPRLLSATLQELQRDAATLRGEAPP
jgi:uncharacterized membrane protein YqjE